MSFSVFTAVFLAGHYIAYLVLPRRLRPYLLMAASAGYCYYLHEMAWFGLTLMTGFVYVAGLILGALKKRAEKTGKTPGTAATAAAAVFIALAVLMLVVYKYSLPLINSGRLTNPHVINGLIRLYFAAGFSYYSFQSVSYLAEIVKGSVRAEKNPVYLALWLAFFPKLASGPIERPGEGLRQIRALKDRPRFEPKRVSEAFSWLVYGFFLKVFFADQLSGYTAMCFADPGSRSAFALLLGALAYSAQLYADFAGYSAIAVGAAQLFGIDLIRNFFSPYLSANITEFWQRWHISLSAWLRDYIYIPLGGNRKGLLRQCVNVVIVFLVSGFWHGNGWTFLIWGAIHAALSAGHTLYRRARKNRRPAAGSPASPEDGAGRAENSGRNRGPAAGALRRVLCTALTFCAVAFAWIFFGSADLPSALTYIRRMFTAWSVPETYVFLKSNLAVVFAGAAAVAAMDVIAYRKNRQIPELLAGCPAAARYALWLAAAVLIFVFGAYGPGYNAQNFIYSQF